MNELDSKTLLKLLIPFKVLAITLFLSGLYVFGYEFWFQHDLTLKPINDFFRIINNRFNIFDKRLYYHLFIGFFLACSFIPTNVLPTKHISAKITISLLLLGVILFYFPFVNPLLYIIFTIIGFFMLMFGFLSIRTGMTINKNKDEFNTLQENFSQFEQKLENPYSVNLPTYYFVKNDEDKLEKRHGWINIVNPFRASLVMGTPGSGKSFCFINPAIEQMLHKYFAMYLYDFKFPTLSTLAYNHFLWAQKEAQKKVEHLEEEDFEVPKIASAYAYANAKCYVLNFDSPAFSHGANPLNAKLVQSDTDAKDAAETIMLALNPESRKNRDFFVLSAINLVQALIMWLRQYKNGKYCTFAHMVELLNIELDELFPILMSVKNLEAIVKPFADAFKEGAMDQLQGQVASAKMPLVAIAGENMWWICTHEDFELDVNDPLEPKLLCVGNNPKKKETYAPLLSLYTSQIIKTINNQNKHHSSVMLDELPTIYLNGLDNLIATARSNKVAVYLGIQDISQLEVGYGKERATALINTIGNFFSGQVQGDTARFVSNMFGKNLQKSTSVSISQDGNISKSVNETRDLIIPENKVANLTQGFFVGRVADDFDQPIDKKLFHCKIDIDTQKIEEDEKKFVDIPIITHFDKGNAPQIYMQEYYEEFTSHFKDYTNGKNSEAILMMEQILCKSDSNCVYTLNYDDFQIDCNNLSYFTLNILKTKLNIHKSFTQELFDKKIKKKLIKYYIKQLCDYDFLERMGQYNGNQNRYYVTIWMKAHVRANYYKIKEDILEITTEVIDELLKNPETQRLFRSEYLERWRNIQEGMYDEEMYDEGMYDEGMYDEEMDDEEMDDEGMYDEEMDDEEIYDDTWNYPS